MGTNKVSNRNLTDDKLDQLILSEYPYPIAVNYKRLLDEQDWEKKTRICIQVFEFGLRAITLGLISQYLIRDVEKVSDPQLNQLLLTRLSRATLGTWNEIFFKALQTYQGKRNLFFMSELYDLYWDTSTSPHRPRKGLRASFGRLIQIRNDLAHGVPPADKAGWQALFEESFRLLRQVLSHFTFLENYDLIRILWAEGGEYWYDIYTGLQVISPSQPLRTEEDLTEGWFYLSKREKRFLELHPLLIFWEKELAKADRERMRDAAIFDRFRRTSLDYLATVLREKINLTDQTLIAQFIQMVYYNIEKVKMARREAKKLTWWLLREVAERVSSERIGDVRSKYRREVYLQREETKRTFEKFLASDKTCLVLIGKSGVGKSNFFLSLMDEYEGSSEVCTLMYNGARFSAETDVAEALTRDFELYLKLEGLVEEEGVKDILFEINRIESIADRKVVVLIDALNENPDAKRLLRRVDALVEANPYPWLKVLISSRPETWRTIKRGVRLAEHKYYREEGTEELGVEMKPFAREELPAAYARYQEVFELQTDYEEIPAEVRQMLRDPLILWLVAEIHRGQEIPQDIKARELYQKYVEALIQTQRLYPEDIRLLERELMPLMIRDGEYANSITGEMIGLAKTTDDKSLFELIYSDEVLSSGRRVNQSYANLVDAEILMESGTDVDYVIVFKYERFYDYYGGKRLLEVVDRRGEEREAVYRELMASTRDHPFLWGAIKTALMAELARGNGDLFVGLAQATLQTVKEMLVAALTEYGQDDFESVKAVLDSLMLVGRPDDRGFFRPLWARVRRQRSELPMSIRMARRVAIEVASALDIREILEEAACDSSAGVRTVAMQYTYYLWKRDSEAGYAVLRKLSNRVHHWWIVPNMAVFESCLGVSLIMLFDDHGEPVRDALQPIWREIIDKLLVVPQTKRSLRGQVSAMVRNILLKMTINIVIRILRRAESEPEGRGMFSLGELSLFFKPDQSKKERFKRLIPYLDANVTDIRPIRRDLIQTAQERDIFTMYLVTLVLLTHMFRNRDATLEILEELLDLSLAATPPTPAIEAVLLTLGNVMYLDEVIDDRAFHLYEIALSRFYTTARCRGQADQRTFIFVEQGPYLHHLFKKTSRIDSPMLDQFLNSVKDKDFPLLRQFLDRLTRVAINTGIVSPAVRTFVTLLASEPQLGELMVSQISRLRLYSPDAVDDVLAELEVSAVLQQRIQDWTLQESFVDLLTNVTFFVRDAILFGESPFLLDETKNLLYSAVESTNLRRWLKVSVIRLANMVYGEPLF